MQETCLPWKVQGCCGIPPCLVLDVGAASGQGLVIELHAPQPPAYLCQRCLSQLGARVHSGSLCPVLELQRTMALTYVHYHNDIPAATCGVPYYALLSTTQDSVHTWCS